MRFLKNVLYISYDGMTDPLGQSQVIPYLKGLSLKGYKIHILSVEKDQNFLKEKGLIETLLSEYNIDWSYISYTKKPPIISTIKDLRKLKKKASSICRNESIDIVHCRSYVSAIVGQYLKRKIGVKFLFDMRGFWADERVDGNIWSLRNPIYKTVYNYFKTKEKQFLSEADGIISLTSAAKQEMLTWRLDIPDDKITVIPCCADYNHFDYSKYSNVDRLEIRKALQLNQSDYVIGYLGSIGTWYLVDEMFECFKHIKRLKPYARFLFISRDSRSRIEARAQQNGVSADDLRIVSANRAEVPKYLSAIDMSLFFIKPLYSKIASSPTKLAEIMGMGIPSICNSNVGDIDQIFAKNEIGYALDIDKIEYSDNIFENLDAIGNIEKGMIRAVGIKLFNLQDGVEKYAAAYERL